MAARPVNSEQVRTPEPTRRDLLLAAAGAALSSIPTCLTSWGQTATTSQASSELLPAAGADPVPWWLGPGYPRSRVVEVWHPQVLHGSRVEQVALDEMLKKGIQALTGAATAADGWRAVLGPVTRIAIKFNQVGARAFGTTAAIAGALLRALREAEYDPGQVTLVEADDAIIRDLGCRRPEGDWACPIHIGSRTTELAGYLLWAEALINVPFLKVHQIAGMSGALKNVSYGVIRHPGRFHDNRCSPYVAQVIANREVSTRLKISLVNALRLGLGNGPDVSESGIIGHSAILLGFDPVAVDAVGYQTLLVSRRKAGLTEALHVPYLAAAADLNVGRTAPHLLDIVRVLGEG